MKKLIIDSIEKKRILQMHQFVKDGFINEGYLPKIQQGDELCDIICERKQAKYGSNGDVVKEIQHALAKCGYNAKYEGGGINVGCKDDKSKCDGLFRRETENAVKEFQSTNGLTPDGSVGKKTLEALRDKGCIDLPNCDCKKKTDPKIEDTKIEDRKIKDDNRIFLEKQLGISDINCDKIVYCIRTLMSVTVPIKNISVDEFKKCLKGKITKQDPLIGDKKDDIFTEGDCKNCPSKVDCMPKINGKMDPICYDAKRREFCSSKCKTQITY
jgi:hypothetical protein